MAEMLIEIATAHAAVADVKPALDAALQQEFPGGMLQRRWEGDVLVVWGPGAKGSITLEGGKLIGRAELSPPASLMKALIEQKIGNAMRRAAG